MRDRSAWIDTADVRWVGMDITVSSIAKPRLGRFYIIARTVPHHMSVYHFPDYLGTYPSSCNVILQHTSTSCCSKVVWKRKTCSFVIMLSIYASKHLTNHDRQSQSRAMIPLSSPLHTRLPSFCFATACRRRVPISAGPAPMT